ncbi:MAG TPA: VOC family protein [Nitrososphaera sp.]|nr:VOC family protein [Nitrososphaera sp.]
MKINKVVETCIYSSDLDGMKKFYVGVIGLPLVQEEEGKRIFLQAGKSMLLIFDPARTSMDNDRVPAHGAQTPPASVHFAMEIEERDYQRWKELLTNNKIAIEKEVDWEGRAMSLYFRDPAGNLVELITPGEWPVES